MSRRASPFSRLARWLATLAGAGIAATAPVAAQSVSPSAAPVEWVRYAESVTAEINRWLEADSETATRLRAYLDATRPAPDQPTAPLMLKVWIDGNGTISRIDFPPFAHAEANANLRALLVGQRLPAAPPRDMLLPLRIAVQIDPPPAAPASGPTSEPGGLDRS
jgi:hypothetical protein